MGDKRLKLGLALGSGSARGLAHLGVLKVLNSEGIKVDIITGCSIGSLIGGLYACDLPLKYLEGLAGEISFKDLTDLSFSRKGLIRGKKLYTFIKILTQEKTFAETSIPFAAIACDIERGEQVVLKEGPVADAIRASVSIPGIYHPFRYRGQLLVDGAVLDRIPVSTCREMGAEVVIAVDVGIRKIDNSVDNMFDVLINTFDIMQNQFESLRQLGAELVIKPELEDVSTFDLDRAEECIEAGAQAASNNLDQINNIVKGRIT